MSDERAHAVRLAQQHITKLQDCIGFFASCIKSGESWSDACQREMDEALGRGDASEPAQVGWSLRNARTGLWSTELFSHKDAAEARANQQTSDPDTWEVLPLYAAEPELLEALQTLVNNYEGVCENLPFGMMGRSEIAKDLAPARAALAKADRP